MTDWSVIMQVYSGEVLILQEMPGGHVSPLEQPLLVLKFIEQVILTSVNTGLK